MRSSPAAAPASLRANLRRAGWLKLWEEVGGVRSNTLAIKVVRDRC